MTTTHPESSLTVPPDHEVPAGPVVDGRRRRGERNREAVIDAILDLLHDGHERPTTSEIAERSGVSVRSVFRHFDDVETLYAAAVERHTERMSPLWQLDLEPASLARRVDRLAEQRGRLYEAMGTVRRVAERLRRTSPAIDGGLARGRELLRSQLEALFADELAAMAAKQRRTVLDALDVGTSWYAWATLRELQGCSVEQATAALRCLAGSVLADR